MYETSLIQTKTARTQMEKSLRLEYYLLQERLPGGEARYGVEVRCANGAGTEQKRVPDIAGTGDRIRELLAMLAAGLVTPTGLADVLQDWL